MNYLSNRQRAITALVISFYATFFSNATLKQRNEPLQGSCIVSKIESFAISAP